MDGARPDGPDSAPNGFEMALLGSICGYNAGKHPSLKSQIATLRVQSRELTGVGSFTTFRPIDPIPGDASPPTRAVLGSDEEVSLPGLKFGIGMIAFLINGSIHMLETYTYGETWAGDWDGFKLIRKPTAE
jgi:hypothetical protein